GACRDVCADKMRNFIFPNKKLANFKPKQPVIYRLAPETDLVLAEDEKTLPSNYINVTDKPYSALSIQLKMNRSFFSSSVSSVGLNRLRSQDTKGQRIIQEEKTVCRVWVKSDVTGVVGQPKIQWTNMYLTPQMQNEVFAYLKSREWQPKKTGVVTVEIFMSPSDAKKYQRFYPHNFSTEEECMKVYAAPFQAFLTKNDLLKKEHIEKTERENRKKNKRFEKALAKSITSTDAGSLSNYVFRTGVLGWVNCDRFYREPNFPVIVDAGEGTDIFTTVIFHQTNGVLGQHHKTATERFMLPQEHEVSFLVFKKINGQRYYAVQEVTTEKAKSQNVKITHFEPLTLEKLKELTKQFDGEKATNG
ncbi:MAG: hypothetical protein ACKVTZ_22135, partial [Bacteroidia bacterium]